MKTALRTIFCLMVLALLTPGAAMAQEAKSFAVLPFAINGPQKYQYLSRGIQDMLISRLSWTDHMEPVNKDRVSAQDAQPENIQAAVAKANSLTADYLVWGSVTIVGDQSSLDVNVTSDSGKNWTESAQTPLSDLIPQLETISGQINNSIFNRTTPAQQQQAQQEQPEPQLNPELLYSESGPATAVNTLNPQFRTEDDQSLEGRLRSSSLPFAATGMVCDDLDSDGRNELVFIEGSSIAVYEYRERRLNLLDKINPGARVDLLNVNLVDMNRDGFKEIAVSGTLGEDSAYSMILNFKNGKLEVLDKGMNFYLNVLRIPPTYTPTLVGQRTGRGRLFVGSVCEVVRMADGFELGKGVALPDESNVFNTSFLPIDNTEYKILVVNKYDRIMVYDKSLNLQHTTEEEYAGSGVGFEYKDVPPGSSTNITGTFMLNYYIPLRMVPVNLNKDKAYEVLVNRNISVAAQFFTRYRSFPQGEVHTLFWDGIGLSLAWKTRRIKGTVVDYGINDVDNDGTMDLYTCVVTHPGALGFDQRKTYVVAYPLSSDSDIKPAY